MMSVKGSLPLVRGRREAILAGDPGAARARAAAGALSARERIGLLTDEASFVELDAFASGEGGESGVVTGYGLVGGQPVYLYAQDSEKGAGAVGRCHADKVLKVMGLAASTGSPIVAIMDSAGARLSEGMGAVDAYARIAAKSAELSGVVPQIALILGPCGGGAAPIAALSDFSLMGPAGRLFVTPPRLASEARGMELDLEAIGGPEASAKGGAAQLRFETDGEAIRAARRLIGLLPPNNLDEAPFSLDEIDAGAPIPELNELDDAPDALWLIGRLADGGEFFELSPEYAPEIATALGRIDGETVGFVGTRAGANGGHLTVSACRKAARFVRFLDCFQLPLVTLADTPGADPAENSQGELARALAALGYAYSDSASPRVAIVTGRAIGAAAASLCSRAAADAVYAWPGAVISPLPVAAAAQLMYKDRLRAAEDPIALREALEAEYAEGVADGLCAARLGLVDDAIEPADTRRTIAAALRMLAGKRARPVAKRHGNMPL